MKKNSHEFLYSLQNLIEKSGFKTRSYSGKFMYGRECLAFEVPKGQTALAAFASILNVCDGSNNPEFSSLEEGRAHELDSVKNGLTVARTDFLGYDTVVYFPGIEYTKDCVDHEWTNVTPNPGEQRCIQCGSSKEEAEE